MTRATVNAICKSMPSAELTNPWGGGHVAWKIGGKMFASIGAMGGGVAVKCAKVQDALHLEDIFGWPKAPYFHRNEGPVQTYLTRSTVGTASQLH
jgi:predicted DNA-binding protein (MmcQ/YjbR family)